MIALRSSQSFVRIGKVTLLFSLLGAMGVGPCGGGTPVTPKAEPKHDTYLPDFSWTVSLADGRGEIVNGGGMTKKLGPVMATTVYAYATDAGGVTSISCSGGSSYYICDNRMRYALPDVVPNVAMTFPLSADGKLLDQQHVTIELDPGASPNLHCAVGAPSSVVLEIGCSATDAAGNVSRPTLTINY